MEWIKILQAHTVRLHGAPCSSLDGVTACVVYTADSIRKFDYKSNRTADSIRDSIRTQKKIRSSLVKMRYYTYCEIFNRISRKLLNVHQCSFFHQDLLYGQRVCGSAAAAVVLTKPSIHQLTASRCHARGWSSPRHFWPNISPMYHCLNIKKTY